MTTIREEKVRRTVNPLRHQMRDVVHVQVWRGPFLVLDVNAPTAERFVAADPGLEETPWAARLVVDQRAGARTLFFPEEVSGQVARHGAEYPLEELQAQGHLRREPEGRLVALPLLDGDVVELGLGELRAVVTRSQVEVPTARLWSTAWMRDHLGPLLAVSGGAHLVVLLLAFMIPVESFALNVDAFTLNDRFASTTPAIPQLPEPLDEPERGDGETEAEVEDGDESLGGQEAVADAKPERHRSAWKPRQKAPVKRDARSSGVLDVLNSGQRATLFEGNLNMAVQRMGEGGAHEGKGAPAMGQGPLGGARLSNAFGFPGAGPGGFKIGQPGGEGVDRHKHRRDPSTALEERGEVKLAGAVKPGPMRHIGNLDRGIIQGRIRSNMAGFRYCYEKRLQANPGLGGQMVVSFTIDSSGRVISAVKRSSTLGDAQVESCVVSRISRLKFPKFEQGVVIVNYPFNFVRRK